MSEQRNSELERLIIANILNNSNFFNKIAPYLVCDYFIDPTAKLIVKKCIDYSTEYKQNPSAQVVRVMISEDIDLSQVARERTNEYIDDVVSNIPPSDSVEYLFDKTQSMAKDNSLLTALSDAYEIWNDPKGDTASIRGIIDKALAINFVRGKSVDLLDDLGAFYDMFTSIENLIEFPLEILNAMTGGGIPRKTLNMLLAGTNVGKTMLLCWLAASYVKLGYNVFYATSEIDEQQTRLRMFASLLDIDLGDMKPSTKMVKAEFIKRTNGLMNLKGKLKIQAWPIHHGSAEDISRAIEDIKSEDPNWKPDVILADHLSLFKSVMMSASVRGVNDHKYETAVAEEFRNLGVLQDAAVWSAAQFNRDGIKEKNGRASNIAGSIGIAYTADFMLGLVAAEDAETITLYQEKSRYSNKADIPHATVGLDYNKQKIFQLDTTMDDIVYRANSQHQPVEGVPDPLPKNSRYNGTEQSKNTSTITF